MISEGLDNFWIRFTIEKSWRARHQWLISVILATQEAEIGRTMGRQPG
jgi:hypothetical protein